jgi:SAM-dependent methyltransferase
MGELSGQELDREVKLIVVVESPRLGSQAMNMWKYFDITHREHILCNPMSIAKFEELIDLLRLEREARVLDIAAGKGEFILRLAERYGIGGVGIDLSPYCIADAQEKMAQRLPDGRVEFLEMEGADYEAERPYSFALTSCLGASWIFDGYRGTLKALNDMTTPDGLIVVGEPYWRQEPAADYLTALNMERSVFGTHEENVLLGEEMGLSPVYTLVSNLDDWDRYEALQWYAVDLWARCSQDDPDLQEVLAKVDQSRKEYLKWGRDTLGWAIYVFRKQGE